MPDRDTERTPLLLPSHDDNADAKTRPGPMELTRQCRWSILAAVWTASFLSALNSTMVATLVGSVSSSFHASHQSSWLGTAYLLATCTFTPLYGRLSNVLGRRGANLTAIVFAAAGTLACGLAPTMGALVLGRFLTGIGGGGVFTTMGIITSDMYTLRDRSMTQGIANIFTGLGLGLGGPFGGFMSDRFGWRWAFLSQLPLWVVAFLLSSTNINYATPGSTKGAKAILKRIDYGGSALLLSAVLSLLFFLSFKYQSDLPWLSVRVIAPLVASGVAFVAFVCVELWVAPAPVLAPFLLRHRIAVLIGMSNFLVAFCNFAIMYFFPMWFETVKLTSAAIAGMHLLPNSLAMSLGSLFAGWYLQKYGKYRMLNVVCGIFPTFAAVLIARLRQDSGWVAQWLSIVTLGFGNAVVLQTTLIALLASLDKSHTAVAIGFGQLWRGIGQVSGVAVSSAIFQSLLDRELKAHITFPGAEDLIQKIRHSSKLVAQLPPDVQEPARAAYAVALRAVFICAACSTFTAFLVRLPIPEQSLDRDATPSTTAAPTPSTTAPPTPVRVESSQDVNRPAYAARVERQLQLEAQAKSSSPERPRARAAKSSRRRMSTYEIPYGGETGDEDDSENVAPERQGR
ncbi:vacuolar amino acid permease [Auricularia subglabra TFB-10046 SS5]|nr:vacuolar amino acid permease [Auricularia subglabra TFB-10046 SS5]